MKAAQRKKDEETEAEEDDTTIEEDETENQKENTSDNKVQTTSVDQSMGGTIWYHHLDTSDSDKETGSQNAEKQIVIASIEPTQGEWRKVEKKKGRKT